jgi:uracil-DNA glycosylase
LTESFEVTLAEKMVHFDSSQIKKMAIMGEFMLEAVESVIDTKNLKNIKLPNISQDWLDFLQPEFSEPYMADLRTFLAERLKGGATIYPPMNSVFEALRLTSLSRVKVVILGQDPYHGPGQAHGLSFSVRSGHKNPPSLENIFSELVRDMNCPKPSSGDLSPWAAQGVLLLNSVLTVEMGQAGAHQGKGWEKFTDKIIEILNEQSKNLVFILWGAYAQKKAKLVSREKHLVIETVHPSPLSAYRGFFGSAPFSQANQYIQSSGHTPIDWRLP